MKHYCFHNQWLPMFIRWHTRDNSHFILNNKCPVDQTLPLVFFSLEKQITAIMLYPQVFLFIALFLLKFINGNGKLPVEKLNLMLNLLWKSYLNQTNKWGFLQILPIMSCFNTTCIFVIKRNVEWEYSYFFVFKIQFT